MGDHEKKRRPASHTDDEQIRQSNRQTEDEPAEDPRPRTEEGQKKRPRPRPDGERPARSRSQNDERRRTRSGSSRPANRKRRRKKKKKSVLKTILIVLLVLLLVAAAVGYGLFRHLYGQMTIVKGSSTPAPAAVTDDPGGSDSPEATPDASTPAPTDTPEPTPSPTPTEEELQKIAEDELITTLQGEAEEILYNDNVYNLLLIGSDGTASIMERSDSLILLSINKETKKIWLTSLMRDTRVYVPGVGYGHLNWTASPTNYGGKGGVDLLVKTIEDTHNFAIHIDNWAQANFLDFAEIAGMLGPITVTITEDEADSMNGLIRQVAQLRDKTLGLGKFGSGKATKRVYFPSKDGTYDISDGIQILAYCRERYYGPKGDVGDTHYGDTGRSNKQREVIRLMWENVKKMNLLQQYALAEKAMSIVTTDLTQGQCASLLLQAPALLSYEIEDQQCPHPYAMSKGMDNGASTYFPDWNVNRNYLAATIYGKPMTAAQLTSNFSGNRVTIIDPTA